MTRAEALELVRRLPPRERAALEATWATRTADRSEHPLAYAELWHRKAPRTSQRESVRALLGEGVRAGFLLGGNRSGKSQAAAQLAVALALGGDDLDVVRWTKSNRIEGAWLPEGPGTVWVSALTFADSRRYVRPKLRAYAPLGSTWKGYDNPNGEAELTLPNGGKIVCKAAGQGRAAYQGDAIRAGLFDEEPSAEVVSECLMRVADQDGRLLFSMTPLMGWTPLLARYVESPRPDTIVRWLHGRDNPHVSPEVLDSLYVHYGSHERQARERGEIVALEGRVYPQWRRDLHVVPDFVPPPSWRRLRCWDFGTRNPTAVLWLAVDPADDVVHVYRCHYRAEWTLSQHAREVHRLSEGEAIDVDVADPADRGSRLALAREHDIATVPARKEVMAGISAVASRLDPDKNGRPHLLVHASCAPVVREVESYVWRDRVGGKGDQPDEPLKRGDHAMDALRYGVQYLARESAQMGALIDYAPEADDDD